MFKTYNDVCCADEEEDNALDHDSEAPYDSENDPAVPHLSDEEDDTAIVNMPLPELTPPVLSWCIPPLDSYSKTAEKHLTALQGQCPLSREAVDYFEIASKHGLTQEAFRDFAIWYRPTPGHVIHIFCCFLLTLPVVLSCYMHEINVKLAFM